MTWKSSRSLEQHKTQAEANPNNSTPQMLVRNYHVSLLLLLLIPAVFSDLAADRATLLRLRTAVRGRTLLWNTNGVTPCSWEGVKCNEITNRVIALRLPGDGLSGQIPANVIGNLTELRVLSLRENSLSGQLPPDLASCTELRALHLEGNRFSGELPGGFFNLRNLVRLNLARNRFSGNLSSGFNHLTRLKILYLENNHFTGSLPDLRGLAQLGNFNISFNGLTGSVPSSLTIFPSASFLGNSLCGGPLVRCSDDGGDELSGGAIAGIAVGSGVLLLLILIVLFFSWKKYKRNRETLVPHSPVIVAKDYNLNLSSYQLPNNVEQNGMRNKNTRVAPIVFFGQNVQVFTLEELLRSSAEVVGKGTVGSTYKACLDNGVEVVVKRLKNVSVSEEEFKRKMEELASMVHENLDPLKGYFYGKEEKLLIYEPKPNRSLSALLHGSFNQPLPWETRAKIAVDAAHGIQYLHSISPQTIHGNIKSSNIFVTDYYGTSRVSEYGLTRLVSFITDSNVYYHAPEVIDSSKVSQQADVYSFGVVLLELLSGKSPERVIKEEGAELVNWMQSVARDKGTAQVFDPVLVRLDRDVEEKMMQILRVAISCTDQEPHRRPSLERVTRVLDQICL